jgi:hypothetical protein
LETADGKWQVKAQAGVSRCCTTFRSQAGGVPDGEELARPAGLLPRCFQNPLLFREGPAMPETTPLLPAWLVLPMAVLTLLMLGGQFWAISASGMEVQRKRLRQATTFLMMLLTPMTAYGFAIAVPVRGREYVLVWGMIAALLFIVIMLALLDMLHSMRVYREQLAVVRRQLAETRARDLAAALSAAKAGGASGGARQAGAGIERGRSRGRGGQARDQRDEHEG